MTVYTTCVGMTTEDIDKIKHLLFFTFVVHLPDSENMKNALYPDYVEVLKYIQIVESAKQVLRPYKKKLISLKDKLVC